MQLEIGDWTIEKINNNTYSIINNLKKCFPYTVTVLPIGVECNCPTFYKNRTCKHSKFVYNMHYVCDMNSDSLLHAIYKDLLDTAIDKLNMVTDLGKFNTHVSTLDEITYENEQAVFGKYYSRNDGTFLSITITKPMASKF